MKKYFNKAISLVLTAVMAVNINIPVFAQSAPQATPINLTGVTLEDNFGDNVIGSRVALKSAVSFKDPFFAAVIDKPFSLYEGDGKGGVVTHTYNKGDVLIQLFHGNATNDEGTPVFSTNIYKVVDQATFIKNYKVDDNTYARFLERTHASFYDTRLPITISPNERSLPWYTTAPGKARWELALKRSAEGNNDYLRFIANSWNDKTAEKPYADQALQKLMDLNDVPALEDVLTASYGYGRDHVETLNAHATPEQIGRAAAKLNKVPSDGALLGSRYAANSDLVKRANFLIDFANGVGKEIDHPVPEVRAFALGRILEVLNTDRSQVNRYKSENGKLSRSDFRDAKNEVVRNAREKLSLTDEEKLSELGRRLNDKGFFERFGEIFNFDDLLSGFWGLGAIVAIALIMPENVFGANSADKANAEINRVANASRVINTAEETGIPAFSSYAILSRDPFTTKQVFAHAANQAQYVDELQKSLEAAIKQLPNKKAIMAQAEKDYQAEQLKQTQAAMQKTMQKNRLQQSDKTRVNNVFNQ